MRKSVALITGASGEIGHGLISRLAETKTHSVVTLDLRPPINDARATKAALAKAIQAILATPPATWSPRSLTAAFLPARSRCW